MNCYANRTVLKARLDTTGTADDTSLLSLLDAASRFIDTYCDRHFYVASETRYYDGASSPWFIPDDILSITTFTLDEDGDATYESTVSDTDYNLYPLNKYPKTWLKATTNGSYSGFGYGVAKAIKIVGLFGHGDGISVTPYRSSGDTVQDDPLSSSATTLNVTAGTNFAVGQTLLIENEQLYVTAIASNTLTVVRAVNGTAAASHVKTTAIYIYEYPTPVVEACVMQAARWWKRAASAYADQIGSPDMGQIIQYKGLDSDVKLMLADYVRKHLD